MDSAANGSAVARLPSKRKKHTFKFSLTISITAAIIFSSFSSAMFMHTAWRLFVTRSTSTLFTRINEEIFISIRNEVSDLFRGVLQVQGTLYSLLQSDLTDTDVDESIKTLYLNTALAYEEFSWLSYGRPNGDFLGVRRLDDGDLQWNVSLYDAAINTATRNRETYHMEGRNLQLVNADELTNGYYTPERPWFKNAIATSTPLDVWTGVYVFSSSRLPGINSSIAIRDPLNNEVDGVVSVAINLGRLSDHVSDIEVSNNGVLFIINDQRELIAYRDRDEVVIVNPDSEQLTLRSLAASSDVRLRVVNDAFNLLDVDPEFGFDERFATVYTSEENDSEYSIFIEPLNNASNIDLNIADLRWYLGITIPTTDILGAIEESSRQLLFITYAIIVGIISLVFIVIRLWLIKPIRQIAQQAEHIKRFELDAVKLPKSSLTEVALLTQSIARMNAGLTSFKKYVPIELVQQLIQKGLEARLGGVESDITIFFCDIAHFTRISEIMREKIVEHLDTYFTNLSNIIGDYDGTIDKYIGDAIMAFWGAPVAQDDHAIRACNAALRCAQALQRLRIDWRSKGQEQLFARFGLNSGKVLVGNFGSQMRMSYTAIGDPVNVASRLESLNKVYGTEIIIGDSTRDQVSQSFITRKLDRVAVYGRTESIEIYELIAVKNNDYHPDAYQWITIFEEGLVHYRNQRWKEAIRCFFKSHSLREGEDGASLLFIKRCKHLAQKSVPGDWDGTFVLQSK